VNYTDVASPIKAKVTQGEIWSYFPLSDEGSVVPTKEKTVNRREEKVINHWVVVLCCG